MIYDINIIKQNSLSVAKMEPSYGEIYVQSFPQKNTINLIFTAIYCNLLKFSSAHLEEPENYKLVLRCDT